MSTTLDDAGRQAPRDRGFLLCARPLGPIADQFNLKGGFRDLIGTLNDNFNNLGFVIIGVFILA